VRENQIWKRRIDHLHQTDDTPKKLSKADERVDSESGLDENEFDNLSVTNDDYGPDASSETIASEQTETRRYPERIRRPP